eukprot:NODE_3131_length_937_cov_93.909877_g3110_i0.p1 GENE.NODE_3131_length_937_cov_93.909877_g3110_i0~~NODE_3131_length_937_cov_93.909877_g3110_i0.p1  ORF type:complete len:277 (+),score=60.20 NODE_3131_length_937_cov_93.909877_g3110_i0:69-833(+)
MDKAQSTKRDLEQSCKQAGVECRAIPLLLDLNDLKSVSALVTKIRGLQLKLDIIVCNAGIMALPKRETTAQGIEKQMGVCHVAHFHLVTSLIPDMNPGARVVCVSSIAYRRCIDTDWMSSANLESDTYEPFRAYGNAKMANLMFARALNQRFKDKGITAFALHPGGIHTNLQVHVTWGLALFWAVVTPFFFKNTTQGGATSVFCAVHPKALPHAGRYFEDCNVVKCKKEHYVTQANLDALWANTEALISKVLAQ